PLVDHDLDGVGIEPEPLRRATNARDIAVVIGTPHVDQVIEPASELVDHVRTVGAEVRVSTVASDEDTVLVVAELRRPEPDGAFGLLSEAGGAEPFDRQRDLPLAFERRLG